MVLIGFNVLVMLNSPDGLRMLGTLEARQGAVEAEIAALDAERLWLKDRAERLMLASLDEDLLEERVRSVLGLARADEYMIRMEDLDRLAGLAPPQSRTRYAALEAPRAQ